MAGDFIPTQQQALAAWAANFLAQITTHTAACGLTLEQVTAYQTAQEAYGAALITATQAATRTKATIQAKDDYKAELVALTREYVQICQASPLMTDVIRADLQIPIRDKEPTPAPVPTEMPGLTVVSVIGRAVDIRLRNALGEKRWPDGAKMAWLFTHIGENPPADLKAWTFEAAVTRLNPILTLSPAATPGTKFWITALWVNPTGKAGPPCAPIFDFANHMSLNQAA